eukprot:3900962-Prymnesium_polylepis.1
MYGALDRVVLYLAPHRARRVQLYETARGRAQKVAYRTPSALQTPDPKRCSVKVKPVFSHRR